MMTAADSRPTPPRLNEAHRSWGHMNRQAGPSLIHSLRAAIVDIAAFPLGGQSIAVCIYSR